MQTAFLVLNTIAFIALYSIMTLKYMHMFQLNSYKPKVQLKWLWNNKKSFIYHIILLIASICVCLLLNESIFGIAVFCFILIGFPLNRIKKAKKPLVFTNRVKRMLITESIVIALITALSIAFADRSINYIIYACVLALSPFMLLLCNTLNQPLEKSINRYYINDAKKMIEDHKNLTVIGVTGSYGKTSVKFILGTLLEAKFNVLITPESYNTTLGVVKTIRTGLRATHDVFVCEMGAKNVGDIKEICDIALPQNGIITSIGPQHLESFKSLDNIKKTKFELADALPSHGILMLNGEDENIADYCGKYNYKKYGFSEDCDYYATNLSVSSNGTSFTVNHNGEQADFTTVLIGRHNVINLLGAIAMCCEMGIKLSDLKPYVRKVAPVEHRLQLIGRGNTTVIDDAYNSNPAGAKAALDVLSLFDGYKILITPGMVELGERQDKENYTFGCNTAKVCDFVALVGTAQTKSIYKGLIDSGFDKDKIFVTDSLGEASSVSFNMNIDCTKRVVLFENDLPDNY